ncbi:MAG: ATP-dependent DNA ligase [Actinobacteria bacterium]|nr:ATP-dependent DNA ligase [Actinomycetota bacterium]
MKADDKPAASSGRPFGPPIKPMEAVTRTELPAPPGWAYEPKWDGFRALAWSGDLPSLDSRNGKPLLRYFPELAPALSALSQGTVVDGEVVVVRDGVLAFDVLQNRIHPAESRIIRLAKETPAQLVAFDLLALEGEDLRGLPFADRRARLETLMAKLEAPWHLTPSTTDVETARRWFVDFEAAGCDGIVAKALDRPYIEGKREMVKVKHRRTIDVVIGGYRVQAEGDRVGSLLLGLYDKQGALHFIRHTSSFSDREAQELLPHLEELRSEESFGADARRPGAESRWTGDRNLDWEPLAPELVAEVSYDQLTGGRFRHATRLERWRPDKDPRDCTMDQLERPSGFGFADVVSAVP